MAGHGLMWSNIYQPEKPTVKRRVNWKRLGALFAPYWRQQVTVLACIVVASALGLVPGFVVAHLIDVTIPSRSLGALGIDVAAILVSALLTAGIGVLQGYLNSLVGEGIMRDIRTSLVGHLHRMPLPFFSGTKTGEIMNRVSNDVQQRRQRRHRNADLDHHQRRPHRDDAGRDVRLELAPRADLGRDRAADGAAARAGRAADVSDSQEDAREPRRDRIDYPRDALEFPASRSSSRSRARRSSAHASIKPVRG